MEREMHSWDQANTERYEEERRQVHRYYWPRWVMFPVQASTEMGHVIYHRVWMMGKGQARGRRKVAYERGFVVIIPGNYPVKLPKVYAFGWIATYENTFHHRYHDGTICYGRKERNPQLCADSVRLIDILRLLDDYVAGMLEYKLRGVWTNGEGARSKPHGFV